MEKNKLNVLLLLFFFFDKTLTEKLLLANPKIIWESRIELT